MASNTLSLFPARIKIVNPDGTMTPEFYRALQVIVSRLGGPLGDNGGDTFVTQQDFTGLEAGSDVSAQVFADLAASAGDQAIADMAMQLQQPTESFLSDVLVLQPASTGGAISAVTVGASPFILSPGKEGFVSVQGGTVSALSLTRGATVVTLGFAAGAIPVIDGDRVTVTYTVAPTVNFIPR